MDRRAFERFVQTEQEALRRFLLNLCGSSALADDLAQETFLRAWLNLHTFRSASKARTWLFAIARNLFYDYAKSSAAKRSFVDIDNAASLSVNADANSQSDISQELHLALATLTAAEREAVLLFYMEEKSIREVACIMGCPASTIKSHLRRARMRLHEHLTSRI